MDFPTEAQIRSIYGTRRPELVQAFSQRGRQALDRAGILETRNRLEFFLAETAYEVGQGASLTESLSYTTPERLMKVWPKRFPTRESAIPYVNNPELLGNFVYGGRLGNTEDGDGYRYRGRGLIQITGRASYEAVGKAVGLDLVGDPDRAADPAFAWDVACGWWTVNDVNDACDTGSIDAVTAVINKWTHSYAERRAMLDKVRAVLGSSAEARSDLQAVSRQASAGADLAEPAVVKAGSPVAQVKVVQASLKAKGYPIGAVDGLFGRLTTVAVLAFQHDAGLPKTGVVDAATFAALSTATERPIAASRAGATAATLRRSGSQTVKTLDKAQLAGWAAAALGLLGAGQSVATDVATAGRGAAVGTLKPGFDALCAVAAEAVKTRPEVGAACRLVNDAVCTAGSCTLDGLTQTGASGLPAVVDVAVQAAGLFLPAGGGALLTLATGVLGALYARRATAQRVEDHRTGVHLGR